MALVMLCNGLVETLCNVLYRLSLAPPQPSILEERTVILGDIQDLICCVAERTFT